jgi:hypothetical protein
MPKAKKFESDVDFFFFASDFTYHQWWKNTIETVSIISNKYNTIIPIECFNYF